MQQTAPHHAAELSFLQSALPNGGRDVLHEINKLTPNIEFSTEQTGQMFDIRAWFRVWPLGFRG